MKGYFVKKLFISMLLVLCIICSGSEAPSKPYNFNEKCREHFTEYWPTYAALVVGARILRVPALFALRRLETKYLLKK